MEQLHKKSIYGAIIVAFIVICFITVISIRAPFLVKESCVLEAGHKLTVDKVVDNPIARIFSSVCVQPDNKEIGKQKAQIRVGVQKVSLKVEVKDRIAPKVETREVSIIAGNTCRPEEFISNIKDATKTNVEFIREPFYSEEGIQKIRLRITDEGGNETKTEAKLIVIGKE